MSDLIGFCCKCVIVKAVAQRHWDAGRTPISGCKIVFQYLFYLIVSSTMFSHHTLNSANAGKCDCKCKITQL